MKDDKKTNMKGNESGKKMVTSTEKQLKNEEEQTPLSKEDEEEIDQKDRDEQQIDELIDKAIVLKELAKHCFLGANNPGTKKIQRKKRRCCFCNQCRCCCGDGFQKGCCNIC
uniref:Uncharacterized protein LOC111121970 n=1 Tax=Crassostrea virginica TaxID=6565 RepID=A0A8B8CVB3_CRAVI|nr:uncharacterized protein LOC111121970 [Crassostrea virginica]